MIQIFCGYSGLLNFLACFSLAVFLYFKSPTGKINKLFSHWSFCVAIWSLGYFVWLFSKDYEVALFWTRALMVGAIMIPSTYLHFALAYMGLVRQHRFIINVCYIFSFLYLLLNLTPLFISKVEPRYWFNWWPVPGPLYHPYQLFFIAVVIYAHYLLFRRALRGRSSVERKQYMVVAVGTLIAFAGGSTNFFLWYNIPIPPVLNFLVTCYVIFIAYAILNYRLWNIELIIKKTLIFAGLFSTTMIIVAGTATVTQVLADRFAVIPPVFSTTLSVMIALLLYDPTRSLLVNITDKYLFQKNEDIKVILNQLSKEIITILDIDKVGKAILSTLERSLRLEAGAILLKDERGDVYKVLDAFGIKDRNQEFQKSDPLVQFFTETNKIVNLENSEEREKLPEALKQALQNLKAVIVIPLFIHVDLIGILFLGKKRSDQEFTADEIESFPTVAGQAAIALSNARLYDKLKKSQIDFAQQAKMAAIGTLSAGISHEIKNPLNHIKVGIAMLRMNKKHGVLDKLERPQLEEEIFKTLEILDENVTRANSVIDRLSSFAKKPKELKIEPVDLRKAMNMALSFIEQELNQYNIAVEKNFPDKFPLVMADLHTLEDVFLNLLVNARHSMEQRGRIAIEGSVQNGELSVSIQDTGKGIPKENLEKIFDPFFTTKDVSRNPDKGAVKGSGLGLFIVRECIQRFGGRITVESEQGKGTTFRIFFPDTTWSRDSETQKGIDKVVTK